MYILMDFVFKSLNAASLNERGIGGTNEQKVRFLFHTMAEVVLTLLPGRHPRERCNPPASD